MTFDEWYTEKLSDENHEYIFGESWEQSYAAQSERIKDVAKEAWYARYETLTYKDI